MQNDNRNRKMVSNPMTIVVIHGCNYSYLHGHDTPFCLGTAHVISMLDNRSEICSGSSHFQKTMNRISKSDCYNVQNDNRKWKMVSKPMTFILIGGCNYLYRWARTKSAIFQDELSANRKRYGWQFVQDLSHFQKNTLWISKPD